MAYRFEVTLHVSGLSVPTEGQDTAKGLYAIRWTRAATPEDAVQKVTAGLKEEERFQSLIRTTQETLGRTGTIAIEPESVTHVSWLKWQFTRQPRSFIFYADEDAV